MAIETASQYATINSTAFVAKVLPMEIDETLLTIVKHDGSQSRITNVQELVDLMNTTPRSDLDINHLIEGLKHTRLNLSDNIPDQEI